MSKENLNLAPENRSFNLKNTDFNLLFNQIINKPIIKAGDDVFTTKNNRTLFIDKEESSISIESFDSEEKFYLKGRIDKDGVAIFNLKTKSEKHPYIKHPDLYAGEFVKLFLDHFQDRNVQIKACCGIWDESSDNYALFEEKYKKTKSLVEAAKSTWSGQQFIKNGFTHIYRNDIEWSRSSAPSIRAVFRNY